jgi:hypothetical protein
MERKKFKRIVVTIALIGVFFTFGTGIKKAQAFYIDDCAFFSIVAGFYQGVGSQFVALSFYYGDPSYAYTGSLYFDEAWYNADTAAYYAYYSSDYYAWDAYLNAADAVYFLDEAWYYAYWGWYYNDPFWADLSIYYGNIAATYLAYVQYFAAYL